MLKIARAALLKEEMGFHLRVILFHSRNFQHGKALAKERFLGSVSLVPRWTSGVSLIIY